MKTSVRWLNEYLEPANITAESAEQALTDIGFPIESTEELPNGDVMLDVEVTSNRGDCLSHIGLAREVAAATGRRLRLPGVPDFGAVSGNGAGGHIAQLVRLDNRVPELCKLFTLRVIRGVKIAPSPAWLADALTAIGQRPINNVVDVTNYVLFELGQPSHAFDLAKLAKGADGVAQVIVRMATARERLTLLDGKAVELNPEDLVVADATGATSLAGIMGGRGSEVSDTTTDVLLEAATWDPLTIRRTSRRLQVSSDACFRFERSVDPRTIDLASRRAADLIFKLGGPGAKVIPGVLAAGAKPEPAARVSLRPARCRALLGIDLPTPDMVRTLRAHEVEVSSNGAGGGGGGGGAESALECTLPAHRPDLEREIDLIEEIARTNGFAKLPVLEKMPVRVAAPQDSERASRELGAALAGMGFFETITFSFVSPKQAQPFLPKDLQALELSDGRRRADPLLRPSIIPSLLACRRANQDAGVHANGGVRLFETASTYAEVPGKPGAGRGKELETRVLALYADAIPAAGSASAFETRQEAFRLMRGVIETLIRTLGGTVPRAEFERADMPFAGLDPAASARVLLRTGKDSVQMLGTCGLVAPAVQQAQGLEVPGVVAELNLGALLALFPPRALVSALAQFPCIERDLSFIVPENTAWGSLQTLVAGAGLERLEEWEFITTYRGAYRDGQNRDHHLGNAGKKAVTVRLRFRDPARTLRHEEVDPQVATLVRLAAERFGAELRM